MATENQLIANKENSQNAGVKTEEGKLRVRFNAYKHGLASKILISDFESLKEAESTLNSIFESFCVSLNPKTSLEEELIHKMAVSVFKSERCEIFEKHTLRESENMFTDKPTLEPNNNMEIALKYKSSNDNSFYKALETLIKLRQVQQLDLFWKGHNE